nr:RHS repeat-associated core domain-containing protein [Lysobacter antibioticus]
MLSELPCAVLADEAIEYGLHDALLVAGQAGHGLEQQCQPLAQADGSSSAIEIRCLIRTRTWTAPRSCSICGFRGRRFDAATGLNYNYFRDYDAATGRYVQSDPIGLGGGAGTYVYANASPLSTGDFFGLAPGDCYKTMDLAAANAVADINPLSIKEGLEYTGWVYKREWAILIY